MILPTLAWGLVRHRIPPAPTSKHTKPKKPAQSLQPGLEHPPPSKKNGSFSLIERVILSAGAMLIFSVSFQIDQMPEGEVNFRLGDIYAGRGGGNAGFVWFGVVMAVVAVAFAGWRLGGLGACVAGRCGLECWG